MNDLIDRQAAIKTLEKGLPSEPLKSKYTEGITVGFGLAITWIEQLPSVQPEIIHCKECKYGVQDEDKRWYCRGLGCQVGEADGSGFCADAERRTDE